MYSVYTDYTLAITNNNMKDKQFVEEMTDIEHERWSSWQKYMFSKCDKGEDGTLIVPAWAVERWQRQIDTPYSELPEEEKETDRRQVRPIIKRSFAHRDEHWREKIEDYRKRLIEYGMADAVAIFDFLAEGSWTREEAEKDVHRLTVVQVENILALFTDKETKV